MVTNIFLLVFKHPYVKMILMLSKKCTLFDLKPALIYITFSTIVYLLILYFAFQINETAIYGRYQYSGSDSMSLFGYLDLAHFRPLAIQELLSWQFFFGNLPLMVFFALFLAFTFHLLQPRTYLVEELEQDIKINSNTKKIGLVCGTLIGVILILEMIFSFLGNSNVGLGSPIYIGQYYRDIPTLIGEGYYVTTNFPYYAQITLPLMPIIFGWGYLGFIHGIKSYRNRGLVSNNLTGNRWVWILLIPALILFTFKILKYPIRIQSSFTGFSLFILVLLLLIGMNAAGWVLVILRKLIPLSVVVDNDKKFHNRGITTIWIILSIFAIVGGLSPLILPYLSILEVGPNVLIPGLKFFQIGGILFIFIILWGWYRRERKDPFVLRGFLAFFIGFAIIGVIMIFFALKKESGDIEISWLYNGIIPSIFTILLTIFFYIGGFWIRDQVHRLISSLDVKKSAKGEKNSKFELHHVKNISQICLISGICILILMPSALGYRLLEDNQIISINNVGFLPNQEKTFFLLSNYDHQTNGSFQLFDQTTNEIIMEGGLIRSGKLWGSYHWKGDITNLSAEGDYYIKTKLAGRKCVSSAFQISSTYLDAVFTTGGYWFHSARCGTQVESISPNYVGHDACHTTDAWYRYKYPNGTIEYRHDLNLTGGWHDSGDYNVYGGVRVPPLSYALSYAYRQVPNFYKQPIRLTTYSASSNDSIPDIVEESYFGFQFWVRRWYEPEQLFFDSNNLGEDGNIRWAVFCAPEYEDQFGDGRWIDDDDNGHKDYSGQFVNSTYGQLVVASLAEFILICQNEGYYAQNISNLEILTHKAYNSYSKFRQNNWHSLVMETAMYELTKNITHLNYAIDITQNIINATSTIEIFPEFRNLGFALDFIQRYNSSLGISGYQALIGNHTIENFWAILDARTSNPNNLYSMLLDTNGALEYHNGKFFTAIFTASYAWNITSNTTIKQNLFNFITTHYDWLLGRNLENVCMLEGVPGGENFVREYQTRYQYIPGNLRGEGLGFIVDGFELPSVDEEEEFEQSYAIRPSTFIYREVWSDVIDQFMLACGAFFHQVLNRI